VRALVTGGAGFIGSHLVEALLARGDEVVVLDDLSTGRLANLPPASERLRIVVGSILDGPTVEQAVAGCEVVFHQAALPSVARSLRDPAATMRTNVEGTAVVLQAALRAGVRRAVLASSSSVYGDAPARVKDETLPLRPRSPYAASKAALEQLAHAYTEMGLPCVCLRYFNVFGPRQDPRSEYSAVIPRFTAALLASQPLTVYGDGHQTRDFCPVANVVAANLRAAESPDAPGWAINVACGQAHSVLDLIEALQDLLAPCPASRIHRAARPGDVRDSLASLDRARMLLGYRPEVGFREGLRRAVAWYGEHR